MRQVRGALIMGAGVAMALDFLVVRESLTDDAYITLAYAKNLALDLHWGLTPQETSNSATSPLNVLLLGAGSALTRLGGGVHPVLALGAISVALAMIMAWAWTRIVDALQLPLTAGAVGLALVLTNPFLLSAIGLEVLLIPTLLVLLLAMSVTARPMPFGLVAGLVVLTRLDLVIFVVLVFAATPLVRREWRRALVSFAAVTVPWFLFSWAYFGSAVPDTLVTKTSQGGLFGGWTFLTGPVGYYIDLGTEVALAFLPALIGAVLLAAWLIARTARRWAPGDAIPAFGPVAALGAGGVAYYAAYAVLDPGVYHWYYVPPLTSLSIFAAVTAGRWFTLARGRAELRAAAPAVVLSVLGLLALASLGSNLSRGVPWKSPVVFGNWASAGDYARVGQELRDRVGSSTVASPGEIGTLAFFCECRIVDEFSDRGRIVKKVNDYLDRAPAYKRLPLELNYLWLDRNQKPVQTEFTLIYKQRPSSAPDSWNVFSEAKGAGSFTLGRGPPG